MSSLAIQPTSDLVVLTPDIHLVNGDRLEDPHDGHARARFDNPLAGTLVLTLAKETRLKNLTVDLVGRQELYHIGGVHHVYETLRKRVELSTGKELLAEGEHRFAFEFIVPADTAPSEKCEHGCTTHKLVAVATPAGRFDTPLTAECKLGMQVNPTTDRDVLPSFSATSKSTNDHLGSVGLQLTSAYLLLAGYLNLSLTLPCISQPVQIHDVRVDLVQAWSMQSLPEPHKVHDFPAETFKLWSLVDGAVAAGSAAAGASERDRFVGETLRPGESWQVERRFPLPDDERIRPSVSPRSVTGIRATHKLAVTLSYTPLILNEHGQLAKGKKMEVHLSTSARLTACWCVLEALQLPYYEQDGEKDEARLAFKACDERNKTLYG